MAGDARADRIREVVAAFDPGADERAARSKRRTLALLAETPAPCSRTQLVPGHMTSSAVVLSPDRARVLLVLHARLGRWLQPGGHVEDGDATILDTALREVLEETGVRPAPGTRPAVAGIDVHEIPPWAGEPRHLHHDVVWSLVADGEVVRPSPESQDVVWARVAALDAFDLDASLRTCVARTCR